MGRCIQAVARAIQAYQPAEEMLRPVGAQQRHPVARRQPLAPGTILLKNKPASVVAASRVSEIKNGRLAMIGVMSVFAEHFIPGSVPLLKNMV